jgi:hypothetical protein
MLETSSKSPWILNYSKDHRKTDLNGLWSDRLTLLEMHPSSILDKDCSVVISKYCTMIWVICIH